MSFGNNESFSISHTVNYIDGDGSPQPQTRAAKEHLENGLCQNCGKVILVMIFRKSGFCCDNCRAEYVGEDITPG